MSKIKVQLTKSLIGTTKRQKLTVRALGLRKVNSTVEHEENNQISGMVRKVSHLVSVIEIK